MKYPFRQLRLAQLDRNVADARNLPERPSSGWISSVREALGLSLAEIGRRIHVPRQNIQMFERAEAQDRITLGTLRRVTEAMGCNLIYVLVPKAGTFAQLAEQMAREDAAPDVNRVVHTMALEDQKPEDTTPLLEGEVQRRLNRGKTK